MFGFYIIWVAFIFVASIAYVTVRFDGGYGEDLKYTSRFLLLTITLPVSFPVVIYIVLKRVWKDAFPKEKKS